MIVESDITDTREFLEKLKELYNEGLTWKSIRSNICGIYAAKGMRVDINEHRLRLIASTLIDKGELESRPPYTHPIAYSLKVKAAAESLHNEFTIQEIKEALIKTIHHSLSFKTIKRILSSSEWAEQVDGSHWRLKK